MGFRLPSWRKVLVAGLIWLGFSFVLTVLLDLPKSLAGKTGVVTAASIAGGAVLTSLTFVFQRVRLAPGPGFIGTALWVALFAYPTFGLLIAGTAFLIVGPDTPFNTEAGLLVFLLGLFGPAIGTPALIGVAFLQPRPWLSRFFAAGGSKAAVYANMTIVGVIAAITWTAAVVRYELTTPNDDEKAEHHDQEQQRWAALEKSSIIKLGLAADFLKSGPAAAKVLLEESAAGFSSEKLLRCLNSSQTVVECGILDWKGSYRSVRTPSNAQCGHCNAMNCKAQPLSDGHRGVLSSTLNLREYTSIRTAAQNDAEWAEPTLLGRMGCEEIAYVVPTGRAHVVVTLSLARLSEQLRSRTSTHNELPQWEMFITDSRGYVVASSTGDMFLHYGASPSLCMTMVDCGGRAPATRFAAIEALADGRSRYALPAQRYARWLGFAGIVEVQERQPNPQWLLSTVTLGPDM